MKAAFIAGKSSTVAFNSTESASISITSDYCLIKVAACSVSYLDYLATSDSSLQTPCSSISGVVTAVGDKFIKQQKDKNTPKSKFISKGTEVVALCHVDDPFWFLPGRKRKMTGALQEYVAVKLSNVAVKPGNLSYIQACEIPLASVVSLNILTKQVKLTVSSSKALKILIYKSDGQIGCSLAQLSVCLGAKVVITSNTNEKDHFLRSFYTKDDLNIVFESSLETFKTQSENEHFDIFIDCSLEGYSVSEAKKFLKPNAKYVSIFNGSTLKSVFFSYFMYNQSLKFISANFQIQDLTKKLENVLKLVKNRRFKAFSKRNRIDRSCVYDFNEDGIRKAFEKAKNPNEDLGIIVVVNESLCKSRNMKKSFTTPIVSSSISESFIKEEVNKDKLKSIKEKFSKFKNLFKLGEKNAKNDKNGTETAVGVMYDSN